VRQVIGSELKFWVWEMEEIVAGWPHEIDAQQGRRHDADLAG